MTSDSSATNLATDKPFPPRVTTYASVGVTLGASVLIALVGHNGWSWPLFAWGALLGPTWVLATAATTAYGMRYIARHTGASDSDVAAAQERSRKRFMAVYPAYAALGLPWGVVSAALLAIWPDLAATLYAVLAVVLPLAALPRIARRAAARSVRDAQ